MAFVIWDTHNFFKLVFFINLFCHARSSLVWSPHCLWACSKKQRQELTNPSTHFQVQPSLLSHNCLCLSHSGSKIPFLFSSKTEKTNTNKTKPSHQTTLRTSQFFSLLITCSINAYNMDALGFCCFLFGLNNSACMQIQTNQKLMY